MHRTPGISLVILTMIVAQETSCLTVSVDVFHRLVGSQHVPGPEHHTQWLTALAICQRL
jgi:hypothetical protein